jgi:hypothetical protein
MLVPMDLRLAGWLAGWHGEAGALGIWCVWAFSTRPLKKEKVRLERAAASLNSFEFLGAFLLTKYALKLFHRGAPHSPVLLLAWQEHEIGRVGPFALVMHA